MVSWSEIEEGNVKITHHSTSSLIEMVITSGEEVQPGVFEKLTSKVWLDYETFSNLKKVVKEINFQKTWEKK